MAGSVGWGEAAQTTGVTAQLGLNPQVEAKDTVFTCVSKTLVTKGSSTHQRGGWGPGPGTGRSSGTTAVLGVPIPSWGLRMSRFWRESPL